ncbi:MAG: ribosome maturation factor RimM [Bacteroidota bacterium]
MDKKDLFTLGRFIKTHKFDGSLILLLDVDSVDRYSDLREIYLLKEGSAQRFALELYELNRNRTAVIRLQGISSAEEARELLGEEVFLPLDLLPELKGNRFYFHEVRGFNVIDTVHGPIGKLSSVIELPHRNLLQVMRDNREILIPLLEHTILTVDRINKTLHVQTPEGLVDIYLDDTVSDEEE